MNYLLAFRAFSEDVMRTINKNLTYLCELYCIDMGEVMYKNIEKRKQRYPQGFDSTRSKNRE